MSQSTNNTKYRLKGSVEFPTKKKKNKKQKKDKKKQKKITKKKKLIQV